MPSGSPENGQSLLLESTDNTSTPKRSSKLKWGLASLAIVVTPVGGTALAAHFAGFNLATMAAGMFSSGTWLSSALTAVGTLGSVWASAAMVAGGLLSVAVSVAVIGLSAVLLKAAFSFISDKTVRRRSEAPAQEEAGHSAAPTADALAQTQVAQEQAGNEFDANWEARWNDFDTYMKGIGKNIDDILDDSSKQVNDCLKQLSTPIDYTKTAAEQNPSTPSTDEASPCLMIEDRRPSV